MHLQALQQLEKPATVSATVQQVLHEPLPRPAPSAVAAAPPSSASSIGSEADGGTGLLRLFAALNICIIPVHSAIVAD